MVQPMEQVSFNRNQGVAIFGFSTQIIITSQFLQLQSNYRCNHKKAQRAVTEASFQIHHYSTVLPFNRRRSTSKAHLEYCYVTVPSVFLMEWHTTAPSRQPTAPSPSFCNGDNLSVLSDSPSQICPSFTTFVGSTLSSPSFFDSKLKSLPSSVSSLVSSSLELPRKKKGD